MASTLTTKANTIIDQIPAMLRMALGVREVRNVVNGVQFRITGTRTVWVTIKHNSLDLYDLQCFTVRNSGRNVTIRFEASDVYAEEMVALLDRMDRGEIVL